MGCGLRAAVAGWDALRCRAAELLPKRRAAPSFGIPRGGLAAWSAAEGAPFPLTCGSLRSDNGGESVDEARRAPTPALCFSPLSRGAACGPARRLRGMVGPWEGSDVDCSKRRARCSLKPTLAAAATWFSALRCSLNLCTGWPVILLPGIASLRTSFFSSQDPPHGPARHRQPPAKIVADAGQDDCRQPDWSRVSTRTRLPKGPGKGWPRPGTRRWMRVWWPPSRSRTQRRAFAPSSRDEHRAASRRRTRSRGNRRVLRQGRFADARRSLTLPP